MQTTQNTVTQAQALSHCAQQLEYVTDAANKHTYCIDTAQEIVHVLQQLLSANANYRCYCSKLHATATTR